MSKVRNGAGRYAGPEKHGKSEKQSKAVTWSKLALGLVTLTNLLLSVTLYLLRRRDIVQAVESDEGVKLLLTRAKETKTGEKNHENP